MAAGIVLPEPLGLFWDRVSASLFANPEQMPGNTSYSVYSIV